MMKIERMKENGKKNLHARASHALDKGDSKVLLIYDNHLNKGLYIYSGKEIRRGISAKHEPFTNFLRKGQLFFSNNFSCEGWEREIGTWPTHWMMDVPTTWTAQVTNATEEKKGGKQQQKKKYSVLFLGVGVAVLLLIIPLDSLLNVTGLGPLCEKGRPTRYKHTEIRTGLVY